MEQKNKEILDELVALLKQLKKDKIAGAPYISRFFNYLKQYSIQDMIDLVANEETRQSLVSLQEEHSPEIKGMNVTILCKRNINRIVRNAFPLIRLSVRCTMMKSSTKLLQ